MNKDCLKELYTAKTKVDFFLKGIECTLRENGMFDVNATQSLILHSIGNRAVNINTIYSTSPFVGTNCNYNIKSMLKKGYARKADSAHDKRGKLVSLTKKGAQLYDLIEKYFQEQSA